MFEEIKDQGEGTETKGERLKMRWRGSQGCNLRALFLGRSTDLTLRARGTWWK